MGPSIRASDIHLSYVSLPRKPQQYARAVSRCAGRLTDAEALTLVPKVVADLIEFFENLRVLIGGDADPGVPHLDPHAATAAPHAEQDPAALGYLTALCNRFRRIRDNSTGSLSTSTDEGAPPCLPRFARRPRHGLGGVGTCGDGRDIPAASR